MSAYVRHIGAIDYLGNIHSVSFTLGVNVVTGKSSTGKSALIEIFDFCFGNSDFTIPDGVITDSCNLFFIVLHRDDTFLLLARRPNENKAFFKLSGENLLYEIDSINRELFEDDYFISIKIFKKELANFFQIQVTDVDEDLQMRDARRQKLPAPSVRSFMSFILQHQNLIANKHAIFYRFDEKEKREQAIDHFKVFMGFVDQEYFITQQELHDLERKRRSLEVQIPKAATQKQKAKEALEYRLNQFHAASGRVLEIGIIRNVVDNPRTALDRLRNLKTEVVGDSDAYINIRQKFIEEHAGFVHELREAQKELANIKSSIDFARNYTASTGNTVLPTEEVIHASVCPFCNSQHPEIEKCANQLVEAINWLNDELEKSQYTFESFLAQQSQVERTIKEIKSKIKHVEAKISEIDKHTEELTQRKSQYELALKAKLQVENILERLLENPDKQLEDELKEVIAQISTLKNALKDKYNLPKKIEDCEKHISDFMTRLGQRFEFEESYRPIKLKFSLNSFDLWHEKKNGKVFLRAMGSGANWLYCHITLFLALHEYFCSLGDSCSIPPILFFDQPSQVYFPTMLDTAQEFSPEELAKIEGNARSRSVDEDLKAVENLYSQLVVFCEEIFQQYGVMPQIIITDHADNLALADGASFESLVQGRRWRTRGFIDTTLLSESKFTT